MIQTFANSETFRSHFMGSAGKLLLKNCPRNNRDIIGFIIDDICVENGHIPKKNLSSDFFLTFTRTKQTVLQKVDHVRICVKMTGNKISNNFLVAIEAFVRRRRDVTNLLSPLANSCWTLKKQDQ